MSTALTRKCAIDGPRVEPGEDRDPAEDGLRGDAEEARDGERDVVAAARPGAQHRDEQGERRRPVSTKVSSRLPNSITPWTAYSAVGV